MDANYGQAPSAFIEIRGREGSKTIYRKTVNSLDDVTDAERVILDGIAKRLPAKAFDAYFEADTIELMLNPNGKVICEQLGGGQMRVCRMREADVVALRGWQNPDILFMTYGFTGMAIMPVFILWKAVNERNEPNRKSGATPAGISSRKRSPQSGG